MFHYKTFLSCVFWQNVYEGVLVPWNLPYPKDYWLRVCMQALFCLQNSPFKCLTVFLIRLCLHNCPVICKVTFMLCTATDTFRILAYSELCLFRYVYSGIFKHIQLRHIHACWDIVKAYSGYSEPWRIFRTLPHLQK